ncbi:MAG: biopolymer transporter ExbD [Limnohabitans sp.]|nr:biopolymer transporter ExbD [Limnohabitans sp.]
MRFGRPASQEPEINLIAFIDVLLVVLIFLMMTTTYGRLTQLDLSLPQADSTPQQERPREIRITVSSDGLFAVQQTVVPANIAALSQALTLAAKDLNSPLVVISADARASHQSVMLVLEAAQSSGLQQITFSAQSRSQTKTLP